MKTRYETIVTLTKEELYSALEDFLQSGKTVLRDGQSTIELTRAEKEQTNGTNRKDYPPVQTTSTFSNEESKAPWD